MPESSSDQTEFPLEESPLRAMTLQRRTQIAKLIQQQGAVRVDELVAKFGVSQVTIRKDLVQLEREGQLQRDRGGAIPLVQSEPIISTLLEFEARALIGIDEKARIGAAAAKMVEPGDTILLDAGTTVVEMVQHLTDISPLTIVTNALNVAYHVSTRTKAKLQVIGGTFYPHLASLHGPFTEASLNEFLVSRVFLAAQAFDLEHGLTDTSLEMAGVKRAMMRAGREVILMADSSKFGRSGFIKVAPFTEIDTLITDSNISVESRAELEKMGVNVIVV
ncbi:glucitol operon repressor [Abditibacteriota bacterium]|nr:glucitol operon repressor [Abditibacteriota bacterium]